MNDAFAISDLLPVLPELTLIAGAMALLMLGAFRGEGAAMPINWLAILLLIGAGAVIIILMPDERLESFGGSFVVDSYARFLKLLALVGSATAVLMSLDFFGRER